METKNFIDIFPQLNTKFVLYLLLKSRIIIYTSLHILFCDMCLEFCFAISFYSKKHNNKPTLKQANGKKTMFFPTFTVHTRLTYSGKMQFIWRFCFYFVLWSMEKDRIRKTKVCNLLPNTFFTAHFFFYLNKNWEKKERKRTNEIFVANLPLNVLSNSTHTINSFPNAQKLFVDDMYYFAGERGREKKGTRNLKFILLLLTIYYMSCRCYIGYVLHKNIQHSKRIICWEIREQHKRNKNNFSNQQKSWQK